ncbi:hypothetical protein BJ322DRAFT_1060594 [Thelephora terrestris]|uniref:Uncharacterized protein n=1 Tax=Thelephora terrestris TaxID=56493 RepID=A0A9P6HF67_9AGAM|nr:hypothetical protein BJ322DRAFT_1060594 [Thelephora terrestris]
MTWSSPSRSSRKSISLLKLSVRGLVTCERMLWSSHGSTRSWMPPSSSTAKGTLLRFRLPAVSDPRWELNRMFGPRDTPVCTKSPPDKVDDDESLFRCQYLMRVLDSFAEELRDQTRNEQQSQPVKDPAKFRSRVLNPIIQRQRRGVADNDPDEVKKAVGIKLEDAVNFYLAQDPLDPQHCRALFRHLLYITPVRMSFACYSSRFSKAVYEKGRVNTEFLRRCRSRVQQDTSDQTLLLPFEVEVIELEGLGGLYRGLIKASATPEISSTRQEGANL